jgi:predicted DNA-binding transcriptional regulator YafY
MGNIQHRINPLGLVVRDGAIYLVASLAANDALRQFVLHRIKSAQVLDEPATSPRGFDPDEYIAKGGFGWPTGRKMRLVAIFDPGPAQTLAETPVSPDQTIAELDGNRFRLTATVQETKELHWWLSSFGPEVEVVEPKRLRAHMRKLVGSSVKRYRN